MDQQLTINATAFKARCLDLMDQIASHKLSLVTITKRGKPVSVLCAPEPVVPKRSIIDSRPKPQLTDKELNELDIEATGILAESYGDFRASKLEARLNRAK
jgi:antitoxin (DNA-binding transcriptional repressor) of toxin-antitoxin stability system